MSKQSKSALLATAFALAALTTLNPTAHAQGALTPPGAPAPTMKSLDQVEARTPISSAPYTITNPGSYYLAGNVSVNNGTAITIATNNVSLDLNGFTIASTASSANGNAIQVNSGRVNVTIYGGHINSGVTNTLAGVFGGRGFSSGISYAGSIASNVRVRAVSVVGVLLYGIYLGPGTGTVVESCTVSGAGAQGINADSVVNSTANYCGNYGISAETAQNCSGFALANGTGIYATTANNCSGGNNGAGRGMDVSGVALGCYGQSLNGIGLVAKNASFCTGDRFGGTAIQATIATGCIAKNGTNLITYKYNMP